MIIRLPFVLKIIHQLRGGSYRDIPYTYTQTCVIQMREQKAVACIAQKVKTFLEIITNHGVLLASRKGRESLRAGEGEGGGVIRDTVNR